MPEIVPALGFDPLRTPFEQAVKNLEARIPRGFDGPTLRRIQEAGAVAKRTDAHWNWHDTLAHQHASSFVVARMAETDLLQTVHGSLVRAKREGWSEARWAKAIAPQLKAAGWWGKQERLNPKTGKMELVQLGSPRRLKIIYRTNMRVSMMAAHYKSLKEASASLPLWRYVAVMDKRTRPEHAALHNKVFRHDHPFWDTHFPPNGWMCRCTVVGESDESLSDLGREIERDNSRLPTGREPEPMPDLVPETDIPTVTQEEIPSRAVAPELPKGVHRKKAPMADFHGVRPDPGWSYNPGQMLWARETMLADRIKELPEAIGKAMIDKMARTDYSPWSALATAAKQEFELIKGVQTTSGTGRRDLFVMRWMPSRLVDALRRELKAASLEPYLVTDRKGAWHAARATKNRKEGSGSRLMPWNEYMRLPSHLARADNVYLDQRDPGVVVVVSPLAPDVIKTVFRVTESRGRQALELVTSGLVKPDAFRDATRWKRLDMGQWGRRPRIGEGR